MGQPSSLGMVLPVWLRNTKTWHRMFQPYESGGWWHFDSSEDCGGDQASFNQHLVHPGPGGVRRVSGLDNLGGTRVGDTRSPCVKQELPRSVQPGTNQFCFLCTDVPVFPFRELQENLFW